MEKICFIAPVEEIKNLNVLVGNIKDICQNQYDFNIIVLCDKDIPNDMVLSQSIVYVKTDDLANFDSKVTLGFQYTIGYDLTVVIDFNNGNYKKYIQGMLQNYSEGSDVVYVKKEVKKDGFFSKIKNFFVNIYKNIKKMFFRMIVGTDELDVYNGFQLFSKNVTEIILSLNENNKYLRNFDCWNGFKVSYVLSNKKEKQSKHEKFWNKKNILGIVLSILALTTLVVCLSTCLLLPLSTRFIYLSCGLTLTVGLAFFGVYNLSKNSVDKKLGK